jgi:hypothetical protein
VSDTQARLDAITIHVCDECGRVEGERPQAGCCPGCGTGSVAEPVRVVPAAELERVTAALREAEDLVAALARDMERDPRTHDAGRVARIIEGILTRAALAGAARAAEEGE